MSLATLTREGGRDLILFLHGLGCAKECFAGLEAPTAYVHGEESANPQVLEHHLASMPQHEIAACGHFPMVEKPAELAAIVAAAIAAGARG